MTDKTPSWRQAWRRCGTLAASIAAVWLVLAGPAHMLSGVVGLEGLSLAAMLSLVPGWLVFWGVAVVAGERNQAMAVLAATCVRLMCVLFGVLILKAVRPDLGLREFHGWVVVFYCASLVVETLLLVKPVNGESQPAASTANKSVSSPNDLVSVN